MKKGIKIIFPAILCSLFLLVGCSPKELYHDDNIMAYFEETDGRLDLSIDFRCFDTILPENTKQTLLTFTPVNDSYNIELSDGDIYGYYNGASNGGPSTYTKPYSSLAELEKDLNMDLISSSYIVYPENVNNMLLGYYPDAMISINFASAKTAVGDASNIEFQLNLESPHNYSDSTSRIIVDISENIRYEELETKDGLKVNVFIDESKGKAGIYLSTGSCLYSWQLNNIQSFDDVKNFVNSLE